MGVANPDYPKSKTKSRSSSSRKRKKLLRGDQVEVRSVEEGFLGSWHPGTVVACRKGTRHVKYDNILCDDGSRFLVDIVDVSPVIDGLDSSRSTRFSYRGCIRPLPPSCSFRDFFLHYGLCVDALYKEAWWEGVIFDYEDGSERRNVFFPDMGDEMTFGINELRITQDWDECTESWKPRGNWLLLELIEGCDQEIALPISIKQLWYDLQEKENFKKVGDWTYADKDLWKELFTEVFHDQFALAVSDISYDVYPFDSLVTYDQPIMELSRCLLDAPSEPGANMGNLSAVVPVECNLSSGMMIHHDRSEMNLWDYNLSEFDEWVDSSCSKTDLSRYNLSFTSIQANEKEMNLQDSMSAITVVDEYTGKPTSRAHKGKKNTWKLAGSEIIPAAEVCYTAVTEFLLVNATSKRPSSSLTTSVRKHLLYLGWKIEFTREQGGPRFRYTSPDGKVYMSLRKVCEDIGELSETIPPLSDGLSMSLLLDQPKASKVETEMQPSSGVVVIEPEYFPQAVADWYSIGMNQKLRGENKMFDLTLKAKKHLSAVGWTISYTHKSGRRQLRFTSPRGKSYYSLCGACKACIDEGETFNANASNCRSSEIMDFSKYPRQDGIANGLISARKQRKPMVRNADLGKSKRGKVSWIMGGSCPPRVLRSGKRAREVALPGPTHNNPRTVLSWLIDNNMVLPREKVKYQRKRDKFTLREGKVTREGIKCKCCDKVYSLAAFEAHAGCKDCQPAANIYLEDGRSIMECQIEMLKNGVSRKTKSSDRLKGRRQFQNNDYICSVCHFGGELILCDRCPSSFHKTCLGLKDIPEGDWFCPSCCCEICGHGKFHDSTSNNDFLNCYQCHRQYHVDCVRKRGPVKPKIHANGNWFCGKNCQKIFLGLHKLLGKKNELGAHNLTWTLQQSRESNSRDTDTTDVPTLAESYSKLNVALEVMHECFETVKDPRTRRDIVEDVIFSRGSNLSRLDFRGFYTVLLEKNEELITVATLRVFGKRVAEVPLVATRFQYRRLGMCRILMNELEKKLMELGIQRLLLPAVPGVLNTWTTSFGFTKMTDSERSDFLDHTFLDFPGTVMCQKLLERIPSPKASLRRGPCRKFRDESNRSVDIVEVDGQGALSEVLQTERMKENDYDGQQSMDFSTSNYVRDGIDLPLVVLETQPTHIECQKIDYQICPGSSDTVANDKKEIRKRSIGELKFFYKRRRVSASGSSRMRFPVAQFMENISKCRYN